MSDVMTPEQRSRAMSHIKGKDTSIEVLLRKALWHGYNWEIKKQKLGHNREYWIRKIERNMARDRENDFKLIAMDWVPMHFWGQEIQKRTEECVGAAEDLIFELQMMQFDGMIDDMRDCVEDIR